MSAKTHQSAYDYLALLYNAVGIPSIADNAGAAVAASGAITFSVNPSASDTITLNGTTVTFVASGATGNQVNIGINLAATLTALQTFLAGSADTQIAKCNYSASSTVLSITDKTTSLGGNAFTLAASVATPSAATLTGGKDAPFTQYYVTLHSADPGDGGNQSTNEIAYTGSGRMAVPRSTAGFTVTQGSGSNASKVVTAADITFDACTGGGPVTATHFSIGVSSLGAGKVLHRAPLQDALGVATSLYINTGVTPVLGAGTTITEA